MNHRLGPDDIAFVLHDAAPRLLVHSVDPTGAGEELRTIGTVVALDDEYDDLVETESSVHVDAAVDLDAPVLLTYTSGTTGRPKGVVLTHANLLYNAMNWLIAGDFRASDVALAITPFFRVGGLAVTLLETFLVGGTNVIMGAFEPRRALQLIEQHRVSVLFGGPELLRGLDADPSFATTDFSSVRVVLHGRRARYRNRFSGPSSGAASRSCRATASARPGRSCCCWSPRDMTRKVGSAGRPVFFTESRVVGMDGAEVAPGDVGEIVARGPNVTPGYWNNPDATRRAIDDDGWLHTGDAARVDDEGYVSIVGSHGRRVLDRRRARASGRCRASAPRTPRGSRMPRSSDAPTRAWARAGVGFVVRAGDDAVTEHEILALAAAAARRAGRGE